MLDLEGEDLDSCTDHKGPTLLFEDKVRSRVLYMRSGHIIKRPI